MKKLNNKGFAITTVLYSLLVMATLVLFLLIGNLSFERRSTDNFVSDIEDELNQFVFDENGNEGEPDEIIPENLVADYVLNPGSNGSIYDDGIDTFITGNDPNNYIWYSGKLWRAVSVNNNTMTVKLVTQWNISAVSFNSSNTNFEGSYMESWLNDTTVDGFLGNLRDYENFIVTDSVWDATMDDTALGSLQRPSGAATVTDAVGLLNMYEYQTSYMGTTYENGYLNNGLDWWTLTPCNSSSVRYVHYIGSDYMGGLNGVISGVRPSINLKFSVEVVGGEGTIDNPYRLKGDDDSNLQGTMLSSRYSGEYVRFGSDENNLYRIVSHENGNGTKIASVKPLKKSSGKFMTSTFGSDVTFLTSNTIGSFLNGDYLTNYVGSTYINMIEDSTIWYLGTVGDGISYKLAKYTNTTDNILTSSTTNAKVGLLRIGELMAGQFDVTGNNTSYWTLTPNSNSYVCLISDTGKTHSKKVSYDYGVRPSLNLKSNVVITGGTGTKSAPFTISLQ